MMRNFKTSVDPYFIGPQIYTLKKYIYMYVYIYIYIHTQTHFKYVMSYRTYASEKPCSLSFISISFNILNNPKMRMLLSPTY